MSIIALGHTHYMDEDDGGGAISDYDDDDDDDDDEEIQVLGKDQRSFQVG